MKSRLAWFIAGILACMAVGVAWAAKKDIVMMTPEDMKWIDVPNAQGAQVANVTGDIFKGKYVAFAKVPAGQVHPLHTHSSDVKAVVVSGTFVVTPDGGTERKLGPGSFFTIPAGVKHLSSCAAGVPCVLYQEGPGKFDMKPVAEKAAEKPAAPK